MVPLVIGIFYLEEDWRGKRAWNKCKSELEAKGEKMDWKDYIPPPVPDDQNFFKAPKMTEWFVKRRSGTALPDEPSVRMKLDEFDRHYSNPVTLAEVTFVPAASSDDTVSNAVAKAKDNEVVLRYSSIGPAMFWENDPRKPADAVTNVASPLPMNDPQAVIPLIQFSDVPITTAIENLARQAAINYMLDVKIGYGQPDQNGEIKKEPILSLRWESITARQALLAILDDYDLELDQISTTGITFITTKGHKTQKPVAPDFPWSGTNDAAMGLIQFTDVPITTAIENLAQQAGLKYSLDPKIGYGKPDENGRIRVEPILSLRWENIPARNALLAILSEYGLQLKYAPETGTAIITVKAKEEIRVAQIPVARDLPRLASANDDLPLIEFRDVPLTTGIENLARQAGVNYILDPKIGYDEPGENGQIKSEPWVTLLWTNISAGQALLAILNQYDLQLSYNPETTVARITPKSKGAEPVYMPMGERTEITRMFDRAIGTNAAGSQGIPLVTQPLNQIQPVRIILCSEEMPTDREMTGLFSELFPDAPGGSGSNRIHVEPAGENRVRIMMDVSSPADYLKWSDQFEPDFDLIREALKRPYARMDGDYSNPYEMPMPNIVNVRVVAQVLAQRAQCHLLLGQPEEAMTELALLNDMRRLLEAAPTHKPINVVAMMIDMAVAGLYTQVIADGFRLQAWRAPQLAALQSELAGINLVPDLITAFRGERASVGWEVGQIRTANTDPVFTKFYWCPGGWLDQNLVVISELNQKVIEGWDPVQNLIFPGKLNEYQRRLAAIKHGFRPYTYFAAIAVFDYSKALETAACNQVKAREGQVACALESYDLEHGSYPESLEALVPQYIGKLPHDIIEGGPLIYRRTDDGKFLLYSIGWNETDDGGMGGLKDLETGDWVWGN